MYEMLIKRYKTKIIRRSGLHRATNFKSVLSCNDIYERMVFETKCPYLFLMTKYITLR